MQVLSAVLAAVAVLAAAGESVVEEALVSSDECWSPTGSSVVPECTLSALQLRTQKGQSPESECAPGGQWCGSHSPEMNCCGDENECLPDGSIFRCQPHWSIPEPVWEARQDYCTPSGQWCGDAAPEKPCCGISDQCVPSAGVFQCQVVVEPEPVRPKEAACMGLGQWCGTDSVVEPCCGDNSACVREGDIFRCRAITCAASGDICGGLSHMRRSCCNSRDTCTLQPGDHTIFRCEEPCVANWGQVCGGSGHRDCECSVGTCKLVWWNVFSQRMRCV